jgi:hypothetical protein
LLGGGRRKGPDASAVLLKEKDRMEKQIDTERFYAALLEEIRQNQLGLEGAQRLVVILLAHLAHQYGDLQWPVRELAEALGVSRSLVGFVLAKLLQNNPFQQFLRIEQPTPGGSYMVKIHQGQPQREGEKEQPSESEMSFNKILFEISTTNRHRKKIHLLERHQIDGLTFVIACYRDDSPQA